MTERRHDGAPGRATQRGVVREFDDAAGLGMIDASDGGEFPFHCIEIADGSRHIEPGTPVVFGVVTKLGRREAVVVTGVAEGEHPGRRGDRSADGG